MLEENRPNHEQENEQYGFTLKSFAEEGVEEQLRSFLKERSDRWQALDYETDAAEIEFYQDFIMSAGLTIKAIKEKADSDRSLVVLVNDSSNNVVGFSLVAIAVKNGQEEVVSNFIGVDWQKTRKGIGRRMVERYHQALRSRGIHSYQADVLPESKALLQSSDAREVVEIDSKTLLINL